MLARTDRIALAGRVGCDPRTVTEWLKDPKSVRRYFAEALERAARELGIDVTKDSDEATGAEA